MLAAGDNRGGAVGFDLLTDFASARTFWKILAEKVKGWINE